MIDTRTEWVYNLKYIGQDETRGFFCLHVAKLSFTTAYGLVWIQSPASPSDRTLRSSWPMMCRHGQRAARGFEFKGLDMAGKYGKHFDFTTDEWEILVTIFDNRCLRCGRHESECGSLAADHIIPHSKGGSGKIANIQPLCKACNSSKSNRFATDHRQVFFGKFRDAYETLENPAILRGKIRMLFRLIFEPGTVDRTFCNYMVWGWRLEGWKLDLFEREVGEWVNHHG